MSTLTTKEIHRLRRNQTLKDRLVISPLLDSQQIKESSVDLRLGTRFVLTKQRVCSHLDATDDKLRGKILGYQEEIYVPFGGEFVLHPGQLALGVSFEYIRLPLGVSGDVIGRSSWGRLGLIIATAISVHPGFAGCLTFELVNDGVVPLHLPTGVRIAHLVLRSTTGSKDEMPDLRYAAQVRPEFSRIYYDRDIQVLKKIREKLHKQSSKGEQHAGSDK